VLRHTRRPHELVLVDNGSTDGTATLLKEIAGRTGPERVKNVPHEMNLGFPVGCNQGFGEARRRYHVLLNNDTVVAEG
jgi:O-antigen biosynthesis protein